MPPFYRWETGLTEVKSTGEDTELVRVRSWASTQDLELWVSGSKGRVNGFPVHYCNWVSPTRLALPNIRKTDPQKDAIKSIQMIKEIKKLKGREKKGERQRKKERNFRR